MIYESSNAFSFGHATKDFSKTMINPELLKTPVVGKYEHDIIKIPNGGFHFNKDKKLKYKRPQTPGPGNYNVTNYTFGKDTPKYSMGKRPKDVQTEAKKQLPGPGTYTLTDENYEKTIGKKTISKHFGKEKRLNYKDNNTPGVGKYEISSYNGIGTSKKNQFSFSKSSRMKLSKEENKSKTNLKDKKGNKKGNKKEEKPQYYQIKPIFGTEGIKPTLKGRPKEKKRQKTPGPGEYNIENSNYKKNIRTTSLGYGNKLDFTAVAKKNNVPGPKYNITSTFNVADKNRIHTIKYIKYNKKKDKSFQTPGPGSYNIPCSFANTPYYQSINNKYRKI